MEKLKLVALRLWKDESGQGTAEYVLILVGVLGAAFVFKDQIKRILEGKLNKLKDAVLSFSDVGGG